MEYPQQLLPAFSLVPDFITGVPKGLMLYGLVRSPHTHFIPFYMSEICTVICCSFSDVAGFHINSNFTVYLQVSILNGSDLKPLINLTGEQVCALGVFLTSLLPIFIWVDEGI